MLDHLVYYLERSTPGCTVDEPTMLSLSYYPTRIVLAEWKMYTHLMNRYFKYYEYTLRDIEQRLHDSDIVDLQRWRRRGMQSRHKLTLLTEFIDYWLQQEHQESDRKPWSLVQRDIQHLQSNLEHYSRSLEQMVPIATSMVQLLDSRRGILEASHVGRLTFIALVFVPLSWVSSIFSMSDGYSPGHEHFWVYFATSVPVLLLVVFLSFVRWDFVFAKLKGIMRA